MTSFSKWPLSMTMYWIDSALIPSNWAGALHRMSNHGGPGLCRTAQRVSSPPGRQLKGMKNVGLSARRAAEFSPTCPTGRSISNRHIFLFSKAMIWMQSPKSLENQCGPLLPVRPVRLTIRICRKVQNICVPEQTARSSASSAATYSKWASFFTATTGS